MSAWVFSLGVTAWCDVTTRSREGEYGAAFARHTRVSNPIASTFGAPCALLPVIHISTLELCVAQARSAFAEGANGVFVISHDGDAYLTVNCAEACAAALIADGHDRPFVGVNLLGKSAMKAYDYLHERGAWDVRAVWCDSPADGSVKHTTIHGVWRALYFAGVAFKYQNVPRDIVQAAFAEADAGADVLTTSGDGTGIACVPEKVRAIRTAVGPRYGVAVASGVDVQNAGGLVAAGADALLVASSIARELPRRQRDFYRFDAGKLRELGAVVKNASGRSVEEA